MKVWGSMGVVGARRNHARSRRVATHPCLLSSSGSGPVELERRAQLLVAREDLILRAKTHTERKNKCWSEKHTRPEKRSAAMPRFHTHFYDFQPPPPKKKPMTKQDAGGSLATTELFLPPYPPPSPPPPQPCYRGGYLFNLNLSTAVSRGLRILY